MDQGAVGLGVVLPVDRPGRLRRFCDAYGLADRAGLVDMILRRCRRPRATDSSSTHLAEGHVDGYERDLVFIKSLREPLEEALTAGRSGGRRSGDASRS